MVEKKWKTRCNGRIIRHGQKGVTIGRRGGKRWKSYCSRSAGISKKFNLDCKGKDKCAPNCLSRLRWKC